MAKKSRPKAMQPAKRVPLSLRVTPQLKAKLDAAATETGRSQTQEIEFRLEQSFDRSELVFGAMTLAYGAQVAAILLAAANAMRGAGRLSGLKSKPEAFTDAAWVDDPYAYEQALSAATTVIKAFRPRGDSSSRTGDGDDRFVNNMNALVQATNSRNWGEWIGKDVLNGLAGRESTMRPSGWRERIEKMLGPIAERNTGGDE